MLSRGICQCQLAILQLHPSLHRGSKNQIGMAEGMIADGVPGSHQLAHEVRPPIHVPPDEKKCCAHVVPGKNVQHMQSVRVVGAIVVSQRQLPGPRFESGKGSAIPLPGRCHGLIANCTGCDGNTNRKGGATHNAAIVNCFSAPLCLRSENRGYSSLNCARRSGGISCHAKP